MTRARHRINRTSLCACALASSVLSRPAWGQTQVDARSETGTWSGAVSRATEEGAYLPLSLTPNAGTTAALASAATGYDSVSQKAVFRSFAEARVAGPLALRFAAVSNAGGTGIRPSLAARVQLLRQDRHGLDGAISLGYKAEGFSEPEGEIETVLAVGRHFGRTLLVANVAYGQDPEGHERDAEVGLAVLTGLSNWAYLGLDARARFNLAADEAQRKSSGEARYAVDLGPVLNLALGPVAFGTHLGGSCVGRAEREAKWGLVVLGSLGTAF